jgi:transcription initiation factor TFIIIB Brf1 subunit/transcription initiation factor TFIIB
MNTLNRISPEEIKVAAKTIWHSQQIANPISQETVDIIMKTSARKFSFFNGKTSRGLVGGLFYLLGYKYDAVKNQKELADRLGTSDVTIRASYRNWLKEFPDLFQDVIIKLAQDRNLRYYILTDLKRKISQQKL